MVAYKHPVTRFADVLVELMHVRSERPMRTANAGIAARQNQTQLQMALRVGF